MSTHKPGPKPKPGSKGEVMASLQAEIALLKAENDELRQRIAAHVAEIAALKTQHVTEDGRPRAERRRATKSSEALLIKKGEREVAINEKPITRQDLDALKRRATEERRQKRAKSGKTKPHAPQHLR